ncbi:MAG: tetratricopeptide repeat protein [Lewinellaceae bacterium]|nr:tetratricopeptide repeat protein [Lewinellaceae bacterium]
MLNLKGNLSQIENQVKSGIISNEAANLARNQIRASIIGLIEEIGRAMSSREKPSDSGLDISTKTNSIPQKLRRFALSAGLLLVLLGAGLGIKKLVALTASRAPQSNVEQRLLLIEEAILKNDSAEVDKNLAGALALAAPPWDSTMLLNRVAALYLEKEEFMAARRIIDQLNGIASRAGDPLYRMDAENKLSYAMMKEERYLESKEHLLYARERARELPEKTNASNFLEAETLQLLGNFYITEKDFSSAHLQLGQAKRLIAKADVERQDYYLLLGDIQFTYGLLFKEKELFQTAAGYYQEAIQSYEKYLTRNDRSPFKYFAYSRLAKSCNNLANIFKWNENYGLPLPLFEQAESYYNSLRTAGFSNFLDEAAKVKYNVASLLQQSGKLREALYKYEGVLANFKFLDKEAPGKYVNAIAICHNAMGGIYMKQKNYSAALQQFQLSKQIREQKFKQGGERYRDALATIYYNLGEVYASSEEPDSSKAYFKKSIDNFELVYQNNKRGHYYNYGNSLFNYAKLLGTEFNEIGPAQDILQLAYEILYENGSVEEERWKELADSIKVYQDKFSEKQQ